MADAPATPADANEGCVGPASDNAGKASACEGCPTPDGVRVRCREGCRPRCVQLGSRSKAVSLANLSFPSATVVTQVASHLADIKQQILVLSGKGGVRARNSNGTRMPF